MPCRWSGARKPDSPKGVPTREPVKSPRALGEVLRAESVFSTILAFAHPPQDIGDRQEPYETMLVVGDTGSRRIWWSDMSDRAVSTELVGEQESARPQRSPARISDSERLLACRRMQMSRSVTMPARCRSAVTMGTHPMRPPHELGRSVEGVVDLAGMNLCDHDLFDVHSFVLSLPGDVVIASARLRVEGRCRARLVPWLETTLDASQETRAEALRRPACGNVPHAAALDVASSTLIRARRAARVAARCLQTTQTSEVSNMRIQALNEEHSPQHRAAARSPLTNVIQACREGQRDYWRAPDVRDPKLKELFSDCATRRGEFARAPEKHLVALGGDRGPCPSSTAGSIAPGWMSAPPSIGAARGRAERLRTQRT